MPKDLFAAYELCRAIHHIYTVRERAMAFKSGDMSVVDGFSLSEAERTALKNHDFAAMYAMDVHPVLLFHLSAILYPREHYLQNVVPKIKGVPNVWNDYYRDGN